MAWGDIERGLGNVAAIPGKILGSVVGGVGRSLHSDPDASAFLSRLPAAYAMGRGDYQGAAQMRAMQYQRQQQELQRQRMENFHAQMEEIFPNGSGFNPSNMDHANQYVRAAIRAGYLFPQAYQMLGTVQSAMAQQATPRPVAYLDAQGNPVYGTPAQAMGQRPVPPQSPQPPAPVQVLGEDGNRHG